MAISWDDWDMLPSLEAGGLCRQTSFTLMKDHRHISVKIPNVKFNFDVRYSVYVRGIKMMSPYHSVQISTQHQIRLRCICKALSALNRNIKVEFDVGYILWYVSIRQWRDGIMKETVEDYLQPEPTLSSATRWREVLNDELQRMLIQVNFYASNKSNQVWMGEQLKYRFRKSGEQS